MTITEMQEAKRKAEELIATIVSEFAHGSGVRVSSIDLGYHEFIGESGKADFTNYAAKLTVRL